MTRSVPEHLAAVTALARPRPAEITPLASAHGLVIAADLPARLPVPPFANSAMDGFLVHSADLDGAGPWTLPVRGDVPAGARPRVLERGAALRIMTGAPVSGDPDLLRVIPVEDTDVPLGAGPPPQTVTIRSFRPDRAHIRLAGENIRVGDPALPAGTLIDAGSLAAAVSCGITEVPVHPRPRVAVVSSGDELLDPGVSPEPGQLPDSNRPMIAALLTELGIRQVTDIHADDASPRFRPLLDELTRDHDLILTTGGVSVGAFDVVRDVTEHTGVWFGRVTQRPGQHQGLGTWRGVPLLCLPGNPVAAFASFLLYAPPLLGGLAGRPVPEDLWDRPHLTARLRGHGLPTAPDRTFLAPVRLSWGAAGATATPFHRQGGSHLVASLTDTHGLAVVPPGEDRLTAGDPVRVLLRLP